MHILVTGADGFIGKNLTTRLRELEIPFDIFIRSTPKYKLETLIKKSNFIIHLAGENRPKDSSEFEKINIELSALICRTIKKVGEKKDLIFASSTQAGLNNPYGKSKLAAESVILEYQAQSYLNLYLYRLPGVFGKWCRPNYNSVVATYCYNLIHNIPIRIDDKEKKLSLVYIDDVIDEFVSTILGHREGKKDLIVKPINYITLNDLAIQIKRFKDSRVNLTSEKVGEGLTRKLYSTYMSYLPTNEFCYSLTSHEDERGIFTEILKTKNTGQFSVFTANIGVTRGGHYHHSKTEKFIVIQGEAKFQFRNINTNEFYEVKVGCSSLKVVETIPGWSHDITNVGKEKLIVILWTNEIFDPDNPDTIKSKVDQKSI